MSCERVHKAPAFGVLPKDQQQRVDVTTMGQEEQDQDQDQEQIKSKSKSNNNADNNFSHLHINYAYCWPRIRPVDRRLGYISTTLG